MQRKNQILERILMIVLIIFVIVLTIFIITEIRIKNERETENQKVENNKENTQTQEIKLTQSQAITIGNELYEVAKNTYSKTNIEYVKDETQNNNEYDTTLTFMIEGNLYTQISNYDNFINNKFTSNGEKALIEYLGILAVQENENDEIKYYIPAADREENTRYIDTELKVSSIYANEIRFNAVSSYYPENTEYTPDGSVENLEKETKTDTFIIKKSKEDNTWKIETFTLPN